MRPPAVPPSKTVPPSLSAALPVSPLAWPAVARCGLAAVAVAGLWLAVGWALEWWGAAP